MPELARTGAGLVLAGPVATTLDGRISPDTPTLHDDESPPRGPARWTRSTRAARTRACCSATPGGVARRRPRARGADLPLREGGWPLIAPSPIAYAPRMPAPRALDADAMAAICDAYVAAARRAAGAGFDVLELDMGHGYLLASFLSPESNRRDDDYGGDLTGRLRFPLQVLDAVREAWPEDRLLAVRLNVMDGTRHGLKLPDGIAIARELAVHGCGLVHVVAGQTVPEAPQADYRRGFLTPLADRVRAEARVPTLVGGYLTTPDEANTILGAGRADLCLLDVPDTDLERQVLDASRRGGGGGVCGSPSSPPRGSRRCASPVALWPVGAVEPHGPHAPLGTDTLISVGMCERAAARLDDAVVLPPLAFGVTRYGAAFAGAIGITEATLRAVVLDVATSLEQQGFRRLVIVNNHFEPEQVATLRAAAADAGALYLDLVRRRNAQRLTDEFRRGSCHAGRYETSLVLADAPQLVDPAAADLPANEVDMPAAMAAGRTDFVAMGMDRAYCGAPAEASAEEGRATFETLTDMLVELVEAEA